MTVEVGTKAPPSVLPDISPSRGKIGSLRLGASSPTLEICEANGAIQSPPLRGRWPAGQRGVFSRNMSAPLKLVATQARLDEEQVDADAAEDDQEHHRGDRRAHIGIAGL